MYWIACSGYAVDVNFIIGTVMVMRMTPKTYTSYMIFNMGIYMVLLFTCLFSLQFVFANVNCCRKWRQRQEFGAAFTSPRR
jgi:hypothetical protein